MSTQAVAATQPSRRGWRSEWVIRSKHGNDELRQSAGTARLDPLLQADPVLMATWHSTAKARAGLHYCASIDALIPHISLFERNCLICADFGGATRIVAQPFTLRWHDGARWRNHTPDFLIALDDTIIIVNARPAELISPKLVENCAAMEALCLSRGWFHVLVTGFQRPAFTTIAAINAHKLAHDPNGTADRILDLLEANGPATFDQLESRFDAPALTRAIIQRMIWDRDLCVDLRRDVTSNTVIHPGRRPNR